MAESDKSCHKQLLQQHSSQPINQSAEILNQYGLEAAYLEAELCSFDGGDVAAWTGADHRDVCIDYRETTAALINTSSQQLGTLNDDEDEVACRS